MMELQISRKNYNKVRLVQSHTHEKQLKDGEVLVKVDSFALTANNITYAVVGDKLGYWQFFPPQLGPDEVGHNEANEHWGILPVWGFADVVKSNNPEVPEGERLFGYFPPSSHLIMHPSGVSESSWIDASEHRAALPVGYNIYRKVMSEPNYQKSGEAYRMLLYPLHVTAFALHHYFTSHDWFGAQQVVITSASSKTSTGLAYGINNDPKAPKQIGLTSLKNKEMVDNLAVYDKTLAYDELDSIDASIPSLIVDMSGNGTLLSELHKHLGDNMKFCSNVGATHWEDMNPGPHFIAQRSEMFFAPSTLQKIIKESGMDGFEKQSAAYLKHSIAQSTKWLKVTDLQGLKAMSDVFDDVCNGKVSPELGLIIHL
ncbi:DUF2855 family protein [Brumicola blandensis]|uniref:DUF2855 family protein n=1 Tax=Brumicola blandensis TaxID=3075611 RepID=A0AAW8R0T4_9ALTE|nr:DUF2855 family protein [Alteromonas sp. W409]MDT0582500.1 DUF2855 family protein [Alteromonas sp. W409]